MKHPTQRQIAQAAGVNVATVSRALANDQRISDETRKKVRSVARRLGWKPNPLASAYMAHLRGTRPTEVKTAIAFVTDHPMSRGVQSLPGHIRLWLTGAKTRAATYGFRVEIASLRAEGMSFRALDRTLYNRGIVGFLVGGFERPGTDIRGIDWNRYSAVTIGFSIADPPLHRVHANVPNGVQELIDRAFAMGYQRVAVIVPAPYDARVNHGVLYPLEYRRHRLLPGQSLDALVLPSDERTEFATIADWLRAHRPEVVIGTDLVWGAIETMDWRVPDDIAYIALDRSPDYPETAGFDQRHDVLGAVAVDVLAGQITHNLRGLPEHPILHTINGQFVPGSSAPGRTDRR